MANWSDLKAAVASIVKTNGNKEITGQLLQNVLNNIISNVGLNSSFAGIATPETNPGTPDGNVFYLSTTAGTYSNFNGIVINSGEAVILEWKGSWVKKDSGFATKEKLTELGSEIKSISDETKAVKNAIVKKINEKKVLYGQYLNSDGSTTSSGSFSIPLFKIEPNKSYLIHNTITGTSTRPSYAIYSSDVLQSENLIEIGTSIAEHNVDTYITSPANSVYLAIQSLNSECSLYETEPIKEVIPNSLENIKYLKDAQFVSGESIAYSSVKKGYAYTPGAYAENASFDTYLYPISAGETYMVYNTLRGANKNILMYGIYTSENIGVDTCLEYKSIAQEIDFAVVTAPEGAAFIAICSYNSNQGLYKAILKTTDELNKDIEAIKNELESNKKGYGDIIEQSKTKSGFIYYDGSLNLNDSFSTVLYPVQPNTQYWVYSSLRSGIARMYAVYSSEELSVDTVLSIGVSVSEEREDTILITTPPSAAYIAVSSYGSSTNAVYSVKKLSLKNTDKEVQSLKGVVEASSSKGNQRMIARLDKDGENLFVAYLNESLTEYVYWFRKCMFNELYTFYRVGYRKVARGYPSTADIESLNGVTIINSTSSDNIGPILFKNGRWAGGNHSFNSDNVTKTAKNESYNIYIDGVKLNAGEEKYADKLQVEVVNSIFDPNQLPSSQVVISAEAVVYSVCKNSIEVSVRQQFADINNPIERYYGMQSMFSQDLKLLVPNGGVDDLVDAPAELYINKADYPKVNRFIEGNDAVGAYQSAYLKPNKDGKHEMVSTTIFNRSYSKCYHYIVDGETNLAGKKVVWSGVYTFFDAPILNDENLFVYEGVINGKDSIYINTKKAFEGSIELPSKYLMKKIQVIEKDDTISTTNEFVDSEGIEINASGTGSMIVLLD